MNSKKLKNILIVLLLSLASSPVLAVYDNPWLPYWQSQESYTSQFWGFNPINEKEPTQPLLPDNYNNNDYASATAEWINDEQTGYVTWAETMMGGHPFWATGVYGGMANFATCEISATLNVGDTTGSLIVYVQYDWYAYPGADIIVSIDGATDITPESYYDYQIGTSGSGNPWYRTTKVFLIELNPGNIVVTLTGSGFATGIDSLSVTTVTGNASELVPEIMPEPDYLNLFTSTSISGDSNWDVWQDDQAKNIIQNAIYLGMYDGAAGHSSDNPDSLIDGCVDGVYTTMSMGQGGLAINQSLGVSGTNPDEFPDNQRDTRAAALFNVTKLMETNSNPDDIRECKFKWCIDYVMPWSGSTTYLQAPTMLYVDIYAADMQNYWNSSLDGNNLPSTDINDLQDEFDPNSAGTLLAEKVIDIRVDDGPWGSGTQPLTNWYIEQNGVQFYEIDVTKEIKELIASDPNKYKDPNTAFVGFTIRASLDGESFYLSMDACDRLEQNPIPPTLEINTVTHAGDFNSDGFIDLYDLEILMNSWLSTALDSNWNAECNLNNSGESKDFIDYSDLFEFCYLMLANG
jgi:hypothetical protein